MTTEVAEAGYRASMDSDYVHRFIEGSHDLHKHRQLIDIRHRVDGEQRRTSTREFQ